MNVSVAVKEVFFFLFSFFGSFETEYGLISQVCEMFQNFAILLLSHTAIVLRKSFERSFSS